MELNYHRWTTSSRLEADLNMYCRYCHYAVSILPGTTDKNLKKTSYKIDCYNESQMDALEDEEEDRCSCKEDHINIYCQECY